MTRVTTQLNMTMQRRTDSIVIAKFLGMALMLVLGFQGLVSGTGDVAPLYAAETGTVSGHSLMEAAGELILKPEKESDRSKVGKKPRRLIRKPSASVPQSEASQQTDQGRHRVRRWQSI